MAIVSKGFRPGQCIFSMFLASLVSVTLAACPDFVRAEPQPVHAIAKHGEPALPGDFSHFPYVNPDAPQGGKITYGVIGVFDSLNPFILNSMRTTARGMWEPTFNGFGKLVFEPLMTRSADEAFTVYPLLAETVTIAEDRSWIEFNLDPNAKWSDGEPVVPEDVIFTYELLAEKGRPPFSSRKRAIERIEKTGERSVKFTFNDLADREFPLIVASATPVLPKHATDVKTFGNTTLTPLVGSGPYLVSGLEPGTRLTYKKRDDYWGKDLPANRGQLNFDTITVEYFQSAQSHFEAFKKGLYDIYPEGDPANWERAFGFPAVEEGRVKKEEFGFETPARMLGFVFNTRRPVFSDRKVRKALAMVFDFEWANKNLFFGAYERTGSFWHGSELSALGRPASDRERELLAPFPEAVLPEVMDGSYRPAVTNGSGRDRNILREATRLLNEAGYKRSGGGLVGPDGASLAFEILTKSQDEERLAIAFKRSLDILGADVSIRSVDDAQFQRRSQGFDYDMMPFSYSSSLSPGVEQKFRWGSASRDQAGSFNFPGAADPAIDAMIDALLNAGTRDDFTAAVRAFDRVLISGHYVVPLFHLGQEWVAYWDRVAHPNETPIYGNQFITWWAKDVSQ